jgi:hypothetical protein
LKDWPLSVQQAIYTLKRKEPTVTWSSRRANQLKHKSEQEIRDAYFGYHMMEKARSIKGYIGKYMTPSFIPEEQLDSGKQMGDMYFSMLKLILWAAECHSKVNKAAARLPNATGTTFTRNDDDIVTLLFISMFR